MKQNIILDLKLNFYADMDERSPKSGQNAGKLVLGVCHVWTVFLFLECIILLC